MNRPFLHIVFCALLFALHTQVYAQVNLLPNGSFEEYDTCPDNLSQIDYAKYWFSPNLSSPDYYNSCSISNLSNVPNNELGFQYAKDGNAYAGIVIYERQTISGYQEYLEIKLTNPLQSMKKYNFSFYFSIANNSYFGTNLISARLSNSIIQDYSSFMFILQPSFLYNHLMTDTLNWIYLNWDYIANGGEEYLSIGVFENNTNIDTVVINSNLDSNNALCYVYIDDVKIIESPIDINIPNVFTPNSDGVNDMLKIDYFGEIANVKIFNRWGTVVFDEKSENYIEWDGTSDGKICSEGTYFCVVTTNTVTKKGSIQLLK